jgi:hypothetical protein
MFAAIAAGLTPAWYMDADRILRGNGTPRHARNGGTASGAAAAKRAACRRRNIAKHPRGVR